MVKVPAFNDIGKATKELLSGGRSGTFQYDKTLTVTSTTADGVEFTLAAINRENIIEPSLKAAYKTGRYSLAAVVAGSGKIALTGGLTNIAPGLAATLTGSLPDQSSAKLAVDYAIPHLTFKTAVGLTATPKVDLAATAGAEGFVVGGDVGYDTSKGAITRWALGAAYTKADYQASAMLVDRGETLKLAYTQNVDPANTVGAEVIRSLTKEATAFTIGYAKKLDGGAQVKGRLDNTGVASVLYEQELRPKTVVALSGQFDALDLNKAPKFGVALGMKS